MAMEHPPYIVGFPINASICTGICSFPFLITGGSTTGFCLVAFHIPRFLCLQAPSSVTASLALAGTAVAALSAGSRKVNPAMGYHPFLDLGLVFCWVYHIRKGVYGISKRKTCSITVHIYILYTYLFLLLFPGNYKHQQSYACIGVDHKVLWKSYVCKDRLYNVWKPRSCSIGSSRKSHFFRESFAYWSPWLKFKGWRLGIGTWCGRFFSWTATEKPYETRSTFYPAMSTRSVYFDGWRNCQQLRLRTVDVSWSWWASHAIDTVGSWIFPTGGLQQLDHDNSVFCWLVVIPTQETLGFWLVNNYDLATHTSIYISYVYIICIPIFPYLYIYIYIHLVYLLIYI